MNMMRNFFVHLFWMIVAVTWVFFGAEFFAVLISGDALNVSGATGYRAGKLFVLLAIGLTIWGITKVVMWLVKVAETKESEIASGILIFSVIAIISYFYHYGLLHQLLSEVEDASRSDRRDLMKQIYPFVFVTTSSSVFIFFVLKKTIQTIWITLKKREIRRVLLAGVAGMGFTALAWGVHEAVIEFMHNQIRLNYDSTAKLTGKSPMGAFLTGGWGIGLWSGIMFIATIIAFGLKELFGLLKK